MSPIQRLIDPEIDDLRPVNEVIEARLGKRVSPATRWRWINKGVNGARLECVRSGGVWCTTAAAFADFLRRQTANCTTSSAEDHSQSERTELTTRQLKAAGLL